MTEVILHIYDVTNSESENTNSAIVQINKIFKDGICLDGMFSFLDIVVGLRFFHGADILWIVSALSQFYGEDEWSFGFCEQGTGVFSCPSTKNPMYTYHESIVLGVTDCSILKVNQIIRELSREWPGISYDLLSKNCNHFCDEFSERLGVPKLQNTVDVDGISAFSFQLRKMKLELYKLSDSGWVNLFANAGGSAMEVAENTAIRLRQARTETSKVAYRFLLGVTSNVGSDSGPLSNSNNEGAAWFKNLITKPSGSSEIQNQDEREQLQQRQEDGKALHRYNSSSLDIS